MWPIHQNICHSSHARMARALTVILDFWLPRYFGSGQRRRTLWLFLRAPLLGLLLDACTHGPACKACVENYDLSKTQWEWVAIENEEIEHKVYVFPGPANKATAPANKATPILLLHELPGLSPKTLRFAKTLSKDFTVYVPLLFGSPNQENTFLGGTAYAFNGEWSEHAELHGSRPITQWTSAVIDRIITRHPGQPIGVIGMCLTGVMPLALLNHKEIKAVVVAQPTLPFFGKDEELGISANEWNAAKRRAEYGDVHVYGVRFRYDTIAKRAKHILLKRELGEEVFFDREITAEEYCKISNAGGAPVCPKWHSTLTYEWCPDLPDSHPINVRRSEVHEFLKTWLLQAEGREGK